MKRSAQPLSQALHPVIVTFVSFVTLTAILGLFAPLAHSVEVILAWDASIEPDLAGYKLYYKTDTSGPPYNGTGATEGDSPIDVGNLTEFSVHSLTDGITYFFVVTAYDIEGLESGYSNEVVYGQTSNPLPIEGEEGGCFIATAGCGSVI